MPNANHQFGYWGTIVLAVVMVLFGLPILLGGLWLITLGGSWYYAFAGLGLLASAWFLFRHEMTAVWIYLATYIGTVIWALWEAGLDGWAQVPRLVAPTVILVLVLLTIPALRGRTAAPRRAMAAAAAAIVAVGASLLGLSALRDGNLVAQETTPPSTETPALRVMPSTLALPRTMPRPKPLPIPRSKPAKTGPPMAAPIALRAIPRSIRSRPTMLASSSRSGNSALATCPKMMSPSAIRTPPSRSATASISARRSTRSARSMPPPAPNSGPMTPRPRSMPSATMPPAVA